MNKWIWHVFLFGDDYMVDPILQPFLKHNINHETIALKFNSILASEEI